MTGPVPGTGARLPGAGSPEVRVVPSPDAVAVEAAHGAAAALREGIRIRGSAHLVATGGGTGTRSLAALRDIADLDWSRVHVWWGDERFVPSGDAERNDAQARAALLDHVPLPAANVHTPPASDIVHDVDEAAAAYARELAAHGSGGADLPPFDVLMLGVGEDAHVASLFPGHPAAARDDVTVVGVRESPKPPPERVSLTFRAINTAREVWFVVAGEGKATAVSAALGGADAREVPAAAARGTDRTVWVLDTAAAARLPA